MPIVSSGCTDGEIHYKKGVRLGEVIYFDETENLEHAKIATENGATQFTSDHRQKPIVDDAGWLYVSDNGVISMIDGSTSVCIKGDGDVRKTTNEILSRIQRERR